MTSQLSVAFLGLRHLHPRSYLPLFAAIPGASVTAVAESDASVLEPFTHDYPVHGYSDWRTLLERERPNLAVLFLPHADCPEAAVACCERGIHVLVEKPMAATSAGIRLMMAAAQQHGVTLSTPYVWRYHPVAVRMKELIGEGVTGRVISCEGRCAAGRLERYLDAHAGWMLEKARSGGGPMMNLGVHWIDLYRWMLADEVVEVIAKSVKVNQRYEVEDGCHALLTFARGTVAALDISYTVPDSYPFGRDLYLALRGSAGVMAWTPSFEGTHEKLFVCNDADQYALAANQHVDFELPSQPGYAGLMGHRFLAELVNAICTGKPPAISAQDGVKTVEIVEAIYQSAAAGRSVAVPRK